LSGQNLARALAEPLGDLLAIVALLQRQTLSPSAQGQVRAIVQNAERLQRLVQGASQDDRANTAPSIVSVAALCEALETDWRRRGGDQNLIVTCHAPADLHLLADDEGLSRVIGELVETALDARAWGVVEFELTAALEPDGVQVSGRLSAPGVLADDTLAQTRCAAALADLNGALEWTFRAGGGLFVAFAFKAERADPERPAVLEAADEALLPPRTHLLIVDDNATNRIVAAALCEMFGCSAETVEDGVEAVEAARERPFDLILMDIRMPRMDGLEATRAIRALPGAAADTPIVALTANADPDQVAAYLAAGMQAVVDKPIKPEALLMTLQRVLCGDVQEARRAAVA